ncbi:MAG: hypothetical protein M3198_19250 [Actinomycetota bacterium]|nr:hypothetical protein [Actinomycetota bacterium]
MCAPRGFHLKDGREAARSVPSPGGRGSARRPRSAQHELHSRPEVPFFFGQLRDLSLEDVHGLVSPPGEEQKLRLWARLYADIEDLQPAVREFMRRYKRGVAGRKTRSHAPRVAYELAMTPRAA